ncbi:unnamed protein product, partial [Prorocentrum cordatum]
ALLASHIREGKDEKKPFAAQVTRLLSVLGPGLMVCLADSDIGGLSTMAMAGSETGYTLVSMQFVLIPALYLVQ